MKIATIAAAAGLACAMAGCQQASREPGAAAGEVVAPGAGAAQGTASATQGSLPAGEALERIQAIAVSNECATKDWPGRGRAPRAYLRGVGLVFARALCHPEREDVVVVSKAKGADETDALAWYDSEFRSAGMSNDVAGPETLRHAYALLIGLGMRESSGQYCEGRDQSADFTQADTAEAGLFQTSWGGHRSNPTLEPMFERYRSDQSGCLLDVFSAGVSCGAEDAENFGTGTGAEWQGLTKSCPAFATEYAAVMLRSTGGSDGEFGPLRRRETELRPACDAMLAEIQALVRDDPAICAALP